MKRLDVISLNGMAYIATCVLRYGDGRRLKLGRIEMELYANVVPKTAENFK